MLMGGTILGPGTIFLMLVGAFVAVFHIDNWTSFYYNIIPIVLFVFVCFTCKSNIQVNREKHYDGSSLTRARTGFVRETLTSISHP